mgnify:CR=1 FL=1
MLAHGLKTPLTILRGEGRRLEQELNREPTPAEIGEQLGIPEFENLGPQEPPRSLEELMANLLAEDRRISVQRVGTGRYIAYLPGSLTHDTGRLRLVGADPTTSVSQVVRAIEKAVEEARGILQAWEDGKGSGESVGHKSGKRIVDLLRSKASDLSDDDLAHMKKVTGYVHRHMAQKPAHPDGSRWEASLKNWGHDPARK